VPGTSKATDASEPKNPSHIQGAYGAHRLWRRNSALLVWWTVPGPRAQASECLGTPHL